MKKEMAKLNADRAEFAEIEVQLSRTKKVADEVSTKLTRFLSEKRRIEEMDGEFKKIMALSQDVDLKLDTLSSSNDALQQIQAKIRQFEEMGKSVEGGFERLEKKKEILTVTSEGVDRNFQRLEGIEKSLQEADRAADELAAKVSALRGEYEMLAANKKDADSAMETVGQAQRGHRGAGEPPGEGAELARMDGAHGDPVRGDRQAGPGAGAAAGEHHEGGNEEGEGESAALLLWTSGRRWSSFPTRAGRCRRSLASLSSAGERWSSSWSLRRRFSGASGPRVAARSPYPVTAVIMSRDTRDRAFPRFRENA